MSVWLQPMYSSWEVSKCCLQAMQFYSNKLNIFFHQQQHARPVIITFQHGMSFCFPFTTGSWGHYISALTKVPDLFSCCQQWGLEPGPWSGAMMMMMFGQNNVLYINGMGAEARQEVEDNDPVKSSVRDTRSGPPLPRQRLSDKTATATSLIYQRD